MLPFFSVDKQGLHDRFAAVPLYSATDWSKLSMLWESTCSVSKNFSNYQDTDNELIWTFKMAFEIDNLINKIKADNRKNKQTNNQNQIKTY